MTSHLQELIAIYYPHYIPTSTTNSPPPTTLNHLNILPYTCCNSTYHHHTTALSHYFKDHFTSVVNNYKPTTPNPCSHFKDIGNSNIPIIHRTAFFLNSLSNQPTNPKQFRPAPHSKAPLDFTNPYSSALAMAYDYLATKNTHEYHEFISLLQLHAKNTKLTSNHLFICWAHFQYPSLKLTLKPPYHQPLFQCQEPACGKIYKQIAGLQYHISRNHSKLPPITNTTSLTCPFTPCSKTYQSTTGMRNHLKKFHLQPHHFEQDKHASLIPATCPILPCNYTFKDQAKLRLHILKSHFWSFSSLQKSE
ncbi:hypothetical protein DSO57_1006363 [Entomophthora muscae]|uniref:Uncharacterized protein n=1 Tax=Entomophthora muscae TaxID=34485 RepID=A0ACC2SXD2_9FUNG|nr:hypothetical protein DSO57_1006363 [Entomophthora muscae]